MRKGQICLEFAFEVVFPSSWRENILPLLFVVICMYVYCMNSITVWYLRVIIIMAITSYLLAAVNLHIVIVCFVCVVWLCMCVGWEVCLCIWNQRVILITSYYQRNKYNKQVLCGCGCNFLLSCVGAAIDHSFSSFNYLRIDE